MKVGGEPNVRNKRKSFEEQKRIVRGTGERHSKKRRTSFEAQENIIRFIVEH